ncbi:Trehalose-6-P synthase/phosphatase complex subunit [Coemansia biformis]|uniref:Trehalose-6-P synthase/phosphatase complex subunit n=1 Tax=Coemansia biformis TaxID=1286918 RepID=A0A9W7YF75_9FUNG|nr:Trehalose-6-P synthase/phosphatase complex subunit [Coemansia biformis]
MEPRVLVVSLFAPYSVSFGSTPLSPAGGAGAQHERPLARSGSVGRNAMWSGRRSSMYRTHTTPLGRSAEPHSRRRSTFSVDSIKLSPISRTSTKGPAENGSSSPGAGASVPAPQSHGRKETAPPHVPNDCVPAGETLCIADKPGPSQLAYRIEEAAGVHTPPPTTLDFTRKLNLDQMREKHERKAGAGKRDRLLRNHLLAPAAPAPAAQAGHAPTGGFQNGVPVPNGRAAAAAAAGQEQSLAAAIAGLQIANGRSEVPLIVQPGDADADLGPEEQFTVEHLNVGNIGLFNAVNASLDLFAERVWIGELGISTDDWSEERKAAVSSKLLDDFETLPVFVSDKEFEGHYGRFSKQLIWPAFHYIMPEMPQWHGWEKSAYEAALATCERFAERIADIYRDGDIIWVNDYHLMLLPRLLRERLPNAKIAFFLHIPFPSSEIFRCLHVRKELLEGMLGADVVGLQTFAYKRHFVQTAKRVLGVEGTPSGLTVGDRHVVVGQYAMGLDPASVEEKWSNASVGELIEFLGQKYAGKHVLVGRDKLDHVKGVRQKMLGYEEFLIKNPEFATNTVLIQIALTTAEHNELQVQVMDVVNRINSRFGTIEHQPVVFFHNDIPYNHYLALLSTADAMVITSLRDGMNLTSHEYVICQRDKKSPLVLSEFVGTYGTFNGGALGINPMDTRAIAQAIKDALVMGDEEKQDRWNFLHRQVLSNSATSFVSSFIADIKSARTEASD